MLVYTVEPNSTTVSRSGTLSIGGQPFKITQDPLACTVTLQTSALGSPFAVGGGTGTIGIATNGSNCSWTASSDVPWATVSPAAGSGNATVGIAVISNAASTAPRSGGVTINGQVVGITQVGTTCTYTLQSTTGGVPGGGGSGSVGVVAAAACTWSSSTNNADWLTINSSGNVGSSDVTFTALANPTSTVRMGTLTVAGLTYTVTQAAAPCSYTLPITSTSVAAAGASGSFGFSTTTAGCAPAPVSFANWITIVSAPFNGTSGTVNYSVAANPGTTNRSGTIQVGDRTFSVTQLGGQCGFSLNSYGALFGPNGGSSSVFGSQSALGCTPDTGTDQPSFILLDQLTGPANNIFTLPYVIQPFPSLTRSIRIGRITFGGAIYTVKQTSY
jgi:hypothetical protein